jgi:putative hemolysin
MFDKLKLSEKLLAFLFIFLIFMLILVYILKIVANPEEFSFKNKRVLEIRESSNPASFYCLEEGGSLRIQGDERYCVFQNGKECEEWAFFRGSC